MSKKTLGRSRVRLSYSAPISPQHELFDIGSDPYEENDLAGDYPNKVIELSEMIVAERQQDGSSAREDVISPMVT